MAGTQVSDAGLAHLNGLEKLRSLTVMRTKVTEAGIADFKTALPNREVGDRWYNY